ncbi:hypothetical protein [Shimia gijangensis]|uniref:hypothetical protein n=1 Tax=Shimia gijangensis TaxID=1470563 RepID=UPI0011148FA7|nr:hypothetical protein [Shimia gijangensis]
MPVLPDQNTLSEDTLKSHASFIIFQKVILAGACAGVLVLGIVVNRDTLSGNSVGASDHQAIASDQ